MIKYNRWIRGVLLFSFILIFVYAGTIFAQSSTNYKIKKSVQDQGGAVSQSTNYKVVEAIGQPSPVTVATSTNYQVKSGFFAGGTVAPPTLLVTPTTLDFGTTLTSLTIAISNAGGGTLTWNVAETPDKPWITSVSPTSGSGDATVTVNVNRSLLSGNSDTGTLAVTSNGGNQNVTVLIAKIPPPVLSVSPTTLDFGTTLTSLTFQISNTGSGTLTWNVAETPDKPWITSVSPTSGSGNATVTVNVNRALLSGNSDTGTLAVTSNGGNQNVTVLIAKGVQPPVLLVTPTTLDFGSTQTSLTFQISNVGGGTLTWNATENPDKPWITSVTPASGTNNQTVTVLVSRAGLGPGLYNGKISVTSNGGNADVTVNMTVSAALTTVKIAPPMKEINLNGTGSTDIMIENVTNLGSFEFTISYNKDVVQIVSASDVVMGPFLGSTGRTVIPVGPTIDNSVGKVVYGGATLGTAGGPTGSGVLATITWKGVGEGTSPLDLNTVKVSDVNGVVIPANEVDGACKVKKGCWADVDTDGDVDIIDIQLVAAHWNTSVGDPNYDPKYDVDNEGQGDGDIDIIDIQLVASWWGKPCTKNLPKQIAAVASTELLLNLNTKYEGEAQIVEVAVEDAIELAGFQLDIVSTSGTLDIQAVQLGELLAQSGNQAYLLGPRVSESGARVVLGAYSFSQNERMKDSGILVRITFPDQSTTFNLENLIFVDRFGNSLTVTSGNFELDQTIELPGLPDQFSLEPNYPNPFNPETEIKYQIPDASQVVLKIYNLLGREIRTLVNKEQTAGYYSAHWDGRNEMGEMVASGIYIYRIEAGKFALSRKMTLLK